MFKKILIPITAALLVAIIASFWISTQVFAQEGSPLARLRRARPFIGQVTEIRDDQFTIQRRDGQEMTFLVNDETRFSNKEKEELSMENLETGKWVAVFAPRTVDDVLTARLVAFLPEDLDPSQMNGFRGSILEIVLLANQFTLENLQGEQATFDVDSSTTYRGEVSELSELEEGMAAGVAAKELEDGSSLAQIVRAGYPIKKHLGKVTEVDQVANTISLKTMIGQVEMTFKVDEETHFRSKDQSIQGLEDLETGMVAVVVAKMTGDGMPVAIMVGAAEREDLPLADKQIGGRITSLEENSFKVRGRDGQEYTVQITEDTRFRSRGGRVNSFDDLKEGTPVMVSVNELENGDFQAQLVIAFPGLFGQPEQEGEPGQDF